MRICFYNKTRYQEIIDFSAYTRSEDTVIINALTPGVSKMPPIYEAIEHFCEEKKSIDPSSRFNIIFFEENGPNYLEDFTLNYDHILLALKSLEPVIITGNIGGGIFVGISFILQVFKAISEKAFRLIILSDSRTPKIATLYIHVLENLIKQVKDMPLFIDIIRITNNDPEEDSRLSKLTKICGGEFYHIKKLNELSKVLDSLVFNKKIKSSSLEDGKYVIPPDSQLFFINLADELNESKVHDLCSICFQKDTKDLFKCKKCGRVAHKSCWAQWAQNTSIGIPHVFRCFNCYNLIKLEKDYIESVKLTKVLQQDINVEVLDTLEYLESLEKKLGPNIIQAEVIMGIPSEMTDFSKLEEISVENEIIKTKENELKFILCPNCNKMITNLLPLCPNCNKKIK